MDKLGNMHINYIIIAHKNPEQLERLIKRLKESWTSFFVHIDKNVDIIPFEARLAHLNNVIFIKEDNRVSTVWGDIGIVDATLNAITEVIKNKQTGFCCLLSGQDYPLKSNNFIYEFLSRHNKTNFIDVFPFPGAWKKRGWNRINRYKINKSSDRGHFVLLPSMFDRDFYSLKTLKDIYSLQSYRGILGKIIKKRKLPGYIQPYGGSQWWSLPMDTIKKVMEFHTKHPDFKKFHEQTLIPDEIFFHSILMKLNKEEPMSFAPPLTYTNWKRKSVPLPVTFKKEDIEELYTASQEKLFARKFNTEVDHEILDELDKFSKMS